MFRFRAHVVVHAPPDALAAYVRDLRNITKWDESTRAVRDIDGAGRTWDVEVDFVPRSTAACCLCQCLSLGPTRLRYEVGDVETSFNVRTVKMRGASEGIHTEENYTMRGTGPNTTDLSYELRVTPRGWRRWLFGACIERRTALLAHAALHKLASLF